MNICIIGGGIAGLTAAYELCKQGHKVSIFEKNAELGGHMATFKVEGARLEKFYHHIFTGDIKMIRLIEELGLDKRLKWLKSSVGTYYHGKLYRFATPLDLLRFSPLSPIDRIRMGLVTLWLRRYKNWHNLEGITARDWIIRYAGKKCFEIVWEPLLRGKFGERLKDIGMVWFWGKIHLRMASRGKGMQKEKLGYLMGSFGLITDALSNRIRNAGGEIHTSSTIDQIIVEDNKVKGVKLKQEVFPFDAVISTTPSTVFNKLLTQMPPDYVQRLEGMQYQAAMCLVLNIKQSFLPFYWVNISDSSIPFVAVIEHTNLIDRYQYNGSRILYISSYISHDNPLYKKNAAKLLEEYLPYLQKLNPNFKTDWVTDLYLFKEDAAQPIISTNYSRQIPDHRTPVEGLYLANTTQIYPEDRGMNYSVSLGQNISKIISEDLITLERDK